MHGDNVRKVFRSDDDHPLRSALIDIDITRDRNRWIRRVRIDGEQSGVASAVSLGTDITIDRLEIDADDPGLACCPTRQVLARVRLLVGHSDALIVEPVRIRPVVRMDVVHRFRCCQRVAQQDLHEHARDGEQASHGECRQGARQRRERSVGFRGIRGRERA